MPLDPHLEDGTSAAGDHPADQLHALVGGQGARPGVGDDAGFTVETSARAVIAGPVHDLVAAAVGP